MSRTFVTTEYDLREQFGCDRGIGIALVSDLHEQDPEPVLKILREAKPSVIMVAGDTFERHGRGCNPALNEGGSVLLDIKFAIIGVIKAIVYTLVGDKSGSRENGYVFVREAGKIAPVVIGLGNHEWSLTQEDYDVIASSGTVVLDNADCELGAVLGAREDGALGEMEAHGGSEGLEAASVSSGGNEERDDTEGDWRGIRVGGLSSVPDSEWLEEFKRKDGFKILISHHPEVRDVYGLGECDLVLSGHAHGGQWRIGGRGIFASRQGLMPRYHHGVYGNMVVSAGCANTTIIPRWGNPCEVVMIRI